MNAAPRYKPSLAKNLHEGNVVIYKDAEHLVVVARKSDRKAPGRTLVLQHLRSRCKHETTQALNAVFMTLDQASVPRADWSPVLGDVVVYRFPRVAMWQVAVRQADDWATSASPRHHMMDLRVIGDVSFGSAVLVHTPGEIHPQSYDWADRVGSVVTTHESSDPSAWVRIEHNLWRSTFGIEGSDAMIRHEMTRGTYHLVSHLAES